MKRKTIATFVIAGLIAMAVFAGTAAADGNAWIHAHKKISSDPYTYDFVTTDNVYGWGFLGDESWPDQGGRVYVVAHKDTWINGTLLVDVSGGNETVPWGTIGFFRTLAWPTTLTPGEYDLILDLNCTGHNGVWTTIPYPGRPEQNITDPIWPFTVTGPSGPGISMNKTASTTTTCPGSDLLTVHIGDIVTYCFNVTNTGDVTLTNLSVIDDRYGRIALVTDSLNPGASATTKSITHTVTESDIPSVTNTATVNATDPDNKPVNDTDTCTIYVAQPPPTQVPALTPIGVLALVCLLSVVTVMSTRIKRRN